LKWIESGKLPSQQNVEIEGTEPYVVGGHTASGYWVDTNRQTTIRHLYAAGDVAGGCPQKYVTGALVEGEIAAKDMVRQGLSDASGLDEAQEKAILAEKVAEYNAALGETDSFFTVEQLEEAMQKVMDTYAGGIGSHYQYNEKQLALADEKIDQLMELAAHVGASDYHELLFVYELRERLTVCKVLIAHLRARKETRWHSFAENLDYPEQRADWLKYVNSRMDEDGQVHMIYRDLVPGGETYEHTH
jgi:adenylylsulfate reductase subunit A